MSRVANFLVMRLSRSAYEMFHPYFVNKICRQNLSKGKLRLRYTERKSRALIPFMNICSVSINKNMCWENKSCVCRKTCLCVSLLRRENSAFLSRKLSEKGFSRREKSQMLLHFVIFANSELLCSFDAEPRGEQSGCTFPIDWDCICYKYRLFAYRKFI